MSPTASPIVKNLQQKQQQGQLELKQRRHYMQQQFQLQLKGIEIRRQKPSSRNVARWRSEAFDLMEQHSFDQQQELSGFVHVKDAVKFQAVSIDDNNLLMEISTRQNVGKTNGKVDICYWVRDEKKPIRSLPGLKRRFPEVNLNAFDFKKGNFYNNN